MEPKKLYVDPLSGNSLLLELTANGIPISTATGFVISHDGRYFLVTN